MIVWALFDSGNGCYTQASEDFENIEIYPIGIDKENKNSHFIQLNLADYSRAFGNSILFDTLDKLPQPDLIIASPPCESWSVGSAMWGGNASWKQERTLLRENLSKFTIRGVIDYELDYVQFKYERSFFNRINGELCIYNTIEIIKRYSPKVYIIENPSSSRIWHYINDILNFPIPYENKTFYNNYSYPLKKPTRFKSNINLHLRCEDVRPDIQFKHFSKSYNERSNIPLNLIMDIYSRVQNYIKNI
ncbi:DNA methyltransferase [Lonepinella sp. BR2904]|uniref:DNA methyltransferase n=1 Tax=Lonepinella sp. BR2904 TaxID=3434551 RepID=UPI003F6DF823